MTAFDESWTILKKLSPSAQKMYDNAKLADLINWINTRKYADESQATQPAPPPYKPPAPPVSFSSPLFPLEKAWAFLKADPIDMHEYPPGSGNFMTLQDMIMARNADARKNMQNITPKPRPTGGNTYDKRPSGWQ